MFYLRISTEEKQQGEEYFDQLFIFSIGRETG